MNTPVRKFVTLLLVWGLAAAIAGYLRLLAHVPPGVVPVVLATLMIGFSIALVRVGWLGEAMRRVGVRGILAAHLVRFLGFYFLWLHTQGRLPAEFAHRAGWGDIVAAGGALALLRVGEVNRPWFRRALVAWNVFGAADLLVAVGTGGWLNAVRPGSMIELASLPLTLVPLFLVPVMLASHVFLLRGGMRENADAKSGAAFA